jgi:hypothetical protein
MTFLPSILAYVLWKRELALRMDKDRVRYEACRTISLYSCQAGICVKAWEGRISLEAFSPTVERYKGRHVYWHKDERSGCMAIWL